MTISRRSVLAVMAQAVPVAATSPAFGQTMSVDPKGGERAAAPGEMPRAYDEPRLEWAMNIIPICSAPQSMGSESDRTAADGERHDIWPIIGGTFAGRGIKGTVVPGGGDFPVIRPDGLMAVDALYRLQTDDDHQIIIHNRGLGYRNGKFRLAPTFNVAGRKYAWLRESLFIANLVHPVPAELNAPEDTAQSNSRLIQVFRVV